MNKLCLYCEKPCVPETSWAWLFAFKTPSSPLCQHCLNQLQVIEGERCRKCHRPLHDLPASYVQEDICLDCIRWEETEQWRGVLQRNVSLYAYNGFLKEMLARYKFRGDYILAKVFSTPIQKALHHRSYDLLVPIPLSEERLAERGFNQAKALADEASLQTTEVLTRLHTEKQSKKSRSQRIHDVQIFDVSERAKIDGKVILLIDDIYTTGATLHQAAKALKNAGAKTVTSFTLARG